MDWKQTGRWAFVLIMMAGLVVITGGCEDDNPNTPAPSQPLAMMGFWSANTGAEIAVDADDIPFDLFSLGDTGGMTYQISGLEIISGWGTLYGELSLDGELKTYVFNYELSVDTLALWQDNQNPKRFYRMTESEDTLAVADNPQTLTVALAQQVELYLAIHDESGEVWDSVLGTYPPGVNSIELSVPAIGADEQVLLVAYSAGIMLATQLVLCTP